MAMLFAAKLATYAPSPSATELLPKAVAAGPIATALMAGIAGFCPSRVNGDPATLSTPNAMLLSLRASAL